jgi:hypothetical protein
MQRRNVDMNFKHLSAGCLVAAMLTFGGVSMAAPASSKLNATETREAAKLLKEVRSDAWHVNKHARRWEMLSEKQTPKWHAYDKQWNLIKPSVEDMNMKLHRLEALRASLTPAEQKAVDSGMPLAKDIAAQTHDLRMFLDHQYSKDLSNPAYKKTSEALAKDARELAQAEHLRKSA